MEERNEAKLRHHWGARFDVAGNSSSCRRGRLDDGDIEGTGALQPNPDHQTRARVQDLESTLDVPRRRA